MGSFYWFYIWYRFGRSVTTDRVGNWVATGPGNADSNIAYSSDNGVTWDDASGSLFGNIKFGLAVATNNTGVWVAGGSGVDPPSTNLTYSTNNGEDWVYSTGTICKDDVELIVTNGEVWIVVGRDDGDGNNIVYSIDNGISWIASTGSTFGTGFSRGVSVGILL